MKKRKAPITPPPGDLPALVAAAQRALAAADFDEAGRQLEQALAVAPRHPDLLTNLGGVRARQQRLDDAALLLERALAEEAGHPQARSNLVAVLTARGNRRIGARELEGAIADLRRALALDPAALEAESALGLALSEAGRLDEAIACYRNVLGRQPGHPAALNGLGVALMGRGRFDEARAVLERAVAASPDRIEPLVNLSAIASELGRVAEAERWARRALELRPDSPQAHNNLGLALREQGQVMQALAHFEQACRLAPGGFLWHSGRLLTLNYLPGIDGAVLVRVHRQVGDLWVGAVAGRATLPPRDPDPGRRLRVGYVSPDFRLHSVAFFLESFLPHHDPAAVEITCYSCAPVRDEVTERLQRLAHRWRDVAALDDAACEALITEDGIDVLVDLAGHTSRNRLAVFARRAAPVQLTYLGYGVTTGLPTMDGLLSDDLADPPHAPRGPETVWPLEGGYLCYRPPLGDEPPVAPLPARARGQITFGSFNNLAKIGDPVLDLWASLLAQVPGARLLVKARALAGDEARARLAGQLAARGVAPDRLQLAPPTAGTREHLALYGQVDVALDTFPYNGTTTTCEALWMGVPVVTLSGATHMSRVGHSILARIGAEDLVARAPESYVRIATTLAGDLDGLERRRSDLRARMKASPLMDGRRLARALEGVYREAWRKALQG